MLYPLIKQNFNKNFEFSCNKISFNQNNWHIFAGLNAVDNIDNVTKVFKLLQQHNLTCARMGAYKPRTNPYSFQGLGASCLPYVFELAGKFNIKIIAMEVLHEKHLEEIDSVLEKLGHPTQIMLQIGTRNTQNFELLKAIGAQNKYPILFKRGFGITLEESLQAAEYLAYFGNEHIIFCLRGVKSLFAHDQRNMLDFSQIPLLKRLIKLPIAIDPSHAVGYKKSCPDGIMDIFHATAQGVISGANMLLLDIHPEPKTAKVDAAQALDFREFTALLEDLALVRETYLKRKQLLSCFSPETILA